MNDTVYSRMYAIIKERYPNYSDTWESSRQEFGQEWVAEFDDAVVKLFGGNMADWNEAIDGYAEFCTDALRSQIFFERTGRYRASSYVDVAAACYHNPDFMLRCYLPGMYISHYVWPHHQRMLRYFRSLIAGIGNVRTFSEVGTGCGMYSKEALALFKDAHGIGYDISEYSLSFTQRVADAYGFGARYSTVVQDIVVYTPAPADLLICQEVLEHLEDPSAFVRYLYQMIDKGGYAYISAAVNAGHVDHIYLYRTPAEVEQQLTAAGFSIVDAKAEYAYGGKPQELTPCHAAFLCRRGK